LIMRFISLALFAFVLLFSLADSALAQTPSLDDQSFSVDAPSSATEPQPLADSQSGSISKPSALDIQIAMCSGRRPMRLAQMSAWIARVVECTKKAKKQAAANQSAGKDGAAAPSLASKFVKVRGVGLNRGFLKSNGNPISTVNQEGEVDEAEAEAESETETETEQDEAEVDDAESEAAGEADLDSAVPVSSPRIRSDRRSRSVHVSVAVGQ
jgi:hypothetical protein